LLASLLAIALSFDIYSHASQQSTDFGDVGSIDKGYDPNVGFEAPRLKILERFLDGKGKDDYPKRLFPIYNFGCAGFRFVVNSGSHGNKFLHRSTPFRRSLI